MESTSGSWYADSSAIAVLSAAKGQPCHGSNAVWSGCASSTKPLKAFLRSMTFKTWSSSTEWPSFCLSISTQRGSGRQSSSHTGMWSQTLTWSSESLRNRVRRVWRRSQVLIWMRCLMGSTQRVTSWTGDCFMKWLGWGCIRMSSGMRGARKVRMIWGSMQGRTWLTRCTLIMGWV